MYVYIKSVKAIHNLDAMGSLSHVALFAPHPKMCKKILYIPVQPSHLLLLELGIYPFTFF